MRDGYAVCSICTAAYHDIPNLQCGGVKKTAMVSNVVRPHILETAYEGNLASCQSTRVTICSGEPIPDGEARGWKTALEWRLLSGSTREQY